MSAKDNRFVNAIKRIKSWTLNNKKIATILYSMVAICLIGVIVLTVVLKNVSKTEQKVYREEAAVFGELTVGVSVDGSIDVGTTTQTLDIDISEYTGGNTSFGGDGAGGMDMMKMFQGSDSSSDSDDERVLEVEEVYVSVGQQISEGDKIARLDSDSVTSIRSKLVEDAASAKNTYDQTVAEKSTTDLSADNDYSINSMYGTYVQSEYDASVQKLQTAVDDAAESLEEANETLTEYQETLSKDQEQLPKLQELVRNAEYSVSNIDRETQLYGWLEAENYREEAQDLLDSCEDEIEELQDKITEQETKITELTIELGEAKKSYELGVIDAKATYDTHTLYYDNSQEILDVTKLQSSLMVEMAEDDLNEANDKLAEFDTYIVDNEIISGHNGVISEVDISAGDELYSDSNILVINDYDEVTVTVDVEEDDIASAQLGAEAIVNIDAFPDTVFEATVTDIGDANYDSSTGITSYEVTVTLTGDLSELYTGMTANVTFITADTKEVIFIPNRAVTRQDGVSTVKVKDTNGKVKTVEVVTGFSDGTNAEVKSGISEGDIVIIESSVN